MIFETADCFGYPRFRPVLRRTAESLLKAYDREKADRLLLLGDVLYHGPRNDLPDGYAPKEVIPMLNARKNDILCIRGNCDTEVDQMVLDFPLMADYALLCIDGRRCSRETSCSTATPTSPPGTKRTASCA